MAELTFAGYREFLNPAFLRAKRGGTAHEVEWRGEGPWMISADGERFIDCLGGYGVFALGHRPKEVIAAMEQVFQRIGLYSQELLNPFQAALAGLLAELSPGNLKYTYFHCGGAESNDAAIKVARLATGRTLHISFSRAFHGKTMGSLSATNRPSIKRPFEPLVPGFVELPWNDLEAFERFMAGRGGEVASVIVEPIQGEGGINLPDDEFLPGLRRITRQYGALLHLDEVQTGLCRTGKFFAAQWWGVEPDLMTLGKALGGGVVAISAVMGTPEVWKGLEENPYYITNTFAGAQPVCAAALRALELYREMDLAEQSREKGEKFVGELRELQNRFPHLIREVRGKGLFIGVEMSSEALGKKVADLLFERRVLTANTMNNPATIRIEPPLIITEELIGEVLSRFEDALRSLSQEAA